MTNLPRLWRRCAPSLAYRRSNAFQSGLVMPDLGTLAAPLAGDRAVFVQVKKHHEPARFENGTAIGNLQGHPVRS
jgi:hypothetical protein